MHALSSWRRTWGTIRVAARLGRRGAVTATPASLPAVLLRDYQEECIQSVLASLDRGQKRVGISLATGAGKTVVFTQLLDRIRPTALGGDRTLILAHRRELVEQAARHCSTAYPSKTVEIEMGSLHASGTADITVASVQSITSGTRIAKFSPGAFKLVLVDEAHHIVASGYMQVLEHFGLHCKPEGNEGPALVGVSATFSRFDGLALGAAIDEIVYHKDYIDMIGDGWLADVVFTTVKSTADLSSVRSSSGRDFAVSELSRAVNTAQANEVTVRTWLAKAAAAGRRSTLVFCVDLSHVADLTTAFCRHGVDAQAVTGETDRLTRSRRLEAFRRGDFPVLLNCGVFTEGTDIPGVDCVVLARPTRSRNLLVQMIGRGMRLHDRKTNCHVIDMVATLATGVVSSPTLFGLAPDELVEGASVADLQALRERRMAESGRMAAPSSSSSSSSQPPIDSVRFTDYDSVLDLIADTSGEHHIRTVSRYSWVQVGQHRYVLSGPTGTYLRLESLDESEGKEKNKTSTRKTKAKLPEAESPDNCRFRVVEVRALPPGISKSPFAPPRELCRVLSLDDAVHAADSYAAKIFPVPFILRHLPWRKGPPTPGQLAFLNKIRDKSDDRLLTADNVTRGAASDMITKIRHGARGWFADIDALRRRRDRRQAAQDAQKRRETVTIGPLAP
ncbi:dead deah box DNA helicase [Grosmannia clavigera kw1407]|uniref:Dead deah box DNA helicase n=1 Tax=Grosmannia clavigera (strain kw1407 / UAMH 11150) TaxID=655863 RepID=F0XI46_GROCL|nr:dead deah box DNA helicase [Grosmannia clavigera kw1407]EFX02629.1 dead deah box DNA helicase [Grosmannia clavigera kw1407]